DGATEDAVRGLEQALGAVIPDAFKRFLRENDGGEPADNEFPVGTTNDSGVNAFLSIREIASERDELASRLPPQMIPIALVEGGNLVLLHLGDGSVHFWDHEYEQSLALAQTFDEFIGGLRPFDPEPVQLRPGQVKSVWIDPSLLDE